MASSLVVISCMAIGCGWTIKHTKQPIILPNKIKKRFAASIGLLIYPILPVYKCNLNHKIRYKPMEKPKAPHIPPTFKYSKEPIAMDAPPQKA